MNGIEDDIDVRTALDWFADASNDTATFWRRINEAKESYRLATNTLPRKLGNNINLEQLGEDKVASYFAQAAALLEDRRSYDLHLGSKIVPFIKHLGNNIAHLRKLPGAIERANRLLRNKNCDPGSAIFELATAVRYAKDGFSVQFIPEAPGRERRPDFSVQYANFSAEIECKRLEKSEYEKKERFFQDKIFRSFSNLVDNQQLNVNVDVVYIRELKEVPVDYLCSWTEKAKNCPLHLTDGYYWKDEYGYGRIKRANEEAVSRDAVKSPLLFGPKLARLLADKDVCEGTYNLTANFEPDNRDPRLVDHFFYGSVVTWKCLAEPSLGARSRHIKTKLIEADKQLKSSSCAIVHIAMDAERDTEASDLRRAKNIEVVTQFKFESSMLTVCLHYFVSRVTETNTWMIDETPERFGRCDLPAFLPERMFDQAELLDNDLPAWHQQVPRHNCDR